MADHLEVQGMSTNPGQLPTRLRSLADVGRASLGIGSHALALKFNGRTTDYGTFNRHADQIANGLIEAGVKPGDRVAIISHNSDIYMEIVIGVIRARAMAVAVNWRLAAPEIEYVLGNADAKVVFVETDLAGALEADGYTSRANVFTWFIDNETGKPGRFHSWRDSQDATPPELEVNIDDDVVVMYTSGTTGRPKGVCLTHRNYLTTFEQLNKYPWGQSYPGEIVFAPSPFFHVSGLNLVFRALAQGGCLVTTASFSPEDLADIIESERINRTVMVPAVMQICLSASNVATTDFSSLRTIFYGGSPITQDLLHKARAVFGCEFVQGYGLTEATGTGTFLRPEDHAPESGKLGSCGRSLPGTEIRVVSADGRECVTREVGEVQIRGPIIMRGYWQNEAATNEAIVDGWFHTGDAGYFDEDGYLYIHDRLKDMIVTGGENVYPAEVENALADHPEVNDVAVIGVPDERWGEAVKALIVARPGSNINPAELLGFVRQRIANYKVPKSIDFVESLPRNPSGKILRRELRAPYWDGHERKIN